jgi:hypothetical protein
MFVSLEFIIIIIIIFYFVLKYNRYHTNVFVIYSDFLAFFESVEQIYFIALNIE